MLGLDREVSDLSTLSVLCKGKLANLFSFLSIVSKPLLCIDLKSAGLHCKHTASIDQCCFLPKRAQVSQQMARSWAEMPLRLAQLCRGAGPQRVSARTVTVGPVMSSQFEFPVLLPGVSSLFRSVCCLDTMVLLGHVNQRGSLCFSELGGSTRMIHVDRGLHIVDPESMASVQENRSKDILVVSLPIEIVSAVIHRVARNFLVLVVWVRGFFKACFIM